MTTSTKINLMLYLITGFSFIVLKKHSWAISNEKTESQYLWSRLDIHSNYGTSGIIPAPKEINYTIEKAEKIENVSMLSSIPYDCNDPITGDGAVINNLGSENICLLCEASDLTNLIDGDLGNYASFDIPIGISVATPVVSIKDMVNTYPSGYRAGFVVQSGGSVLHTTLYNSFQIKTLLNGALQETANYGGGGTLEANLIAGTSGAKRLSFITTLPFDEVELTLTSSLTGINNLKVFYAFVDADPNCNYNCLQPLSPPLFSSAVNGAGTGIDGFCLFCSVNNTGSTVDVDTSNYATINMPTSIGAEGTISVFAGEDLPAGYDAGVAVSDGSGLLGTLTATLLSKITINTFLDGLPAESVAVDSSLANIGLLPGSENINLLSFKTTMPFDEIQLSIGGIFTTTNVRVYYAFVRPDSDNDGVSDCVDKCDGGNDLLDVDGDGQPDECDFDCTLSSSYDISICPEETTAQLSAPGIGERWSALSGNPGSVSVDSSGFVSNLQEEGTYFFQLSNGVCSDTFQLNFQLSNFNGACNMPLVGDHVVLDDTNNTGGICLLCGAADANKLTDGNLANYMNYDATLSLLSSQSIISLKDTSNIYPENTRTGFVISSDDGLLNVDVLNQLEIRTYLGDVFQEAAAWGGVLGASALPGSSNQTRLSFVTAKEFDEVELVAKGVLGLLTNLRIYYGFTEPENGCNGQPSLGDCLQLLSVTNEYAANVDYDETGLDAVACVNCYLENIGNLIDDDINTYTTINLTVGVGASASLAVASPNVFDEGYEAGFIVDGAAHWLEASVLGGMTMKTYLNGVQQETFMGSSGLLKVSLLPTDGNKGFLTCRPSLPFNEIKLEVSAVVAALAETKVYSAFVRSDIDGDGVPDCYDKCCGSPDYLDMDENGLVDCVDPQCLLYGTPVAQNDTFEICPSLRFSAYLSGNDNSLVFPTFSIISQPDNGTVIVDQDGYFWYTGSSYTCGYEQFVYQVCNGNNSDCCSTATVTIGMTDSQSPVLENIPADLTIQCDDFPPSSLQVMATDNCNNISIQIDEVMTSFLGPTCNSYRLERTWTASDCCMNKDVATQIITVEDRSSPSIFHIYTLPNGQKLIAGVANLVSGNWKEVVFPEAFSSTPVVFTQVTSDNDAATVVVQTRKVESSHFEIRLKEEEAADGLHTGETVAWIAVEPGLLGGTNSCEIKNSITIGSTLGTLAFAQSYGQVPNLLSSLQSNVSQDPVSLRTQLVTEDSAQTFLQEEISKDIETIHPTEEIAYLAIEPGSFLSDENEVVFGENGSLQVTTNWQFVNFQNSYLNPVVVAGPLSLNDPEPATTRIRNVSKTGFEIRLEEWDYQDGAHAPETVSYVVVEGSLPTPVDGFCRYDQSDFADNLIGWDNCEGYVPISHSATPIDSIGIIYVNHEWQVTDECGNTTAFSVTAPCTGVSLKLKMSLTGPLIANGGGTIMRDDLRSLNLIPSQEPYSAMPTFQHTGYGGEEKMDDVIKEIHGENALVDWAFLEIRNPVNPQEVLSSQSILLYQDGHTTNAWGDSTITVLGLLESDYYVSVRHRNHLGIMTGSSYLLSTDDPPLIDLTIDSTEIYGNEVAFFNSNGHCSLWAGDLNADGKAIYQGPSNDIFPILNCVITAPDNTDLLANFIYQTYTPEDLNLDGKAIFQGPKNDRALLLFNTTLRHLSNSQNYTNFIVNEVLP